MRASIRPSPARFTSFVLLLLAVTRLAASSHEDLLIKAMRDELARTVDQLKTQGGPAPYFAAYRVDDVAAGKVVAQLGGIVEQQKLRTLGRAAVVELRVGSLQLDQTNYLTNYNNAPAGPVFATDLPRDDNYNEIRRQLWLISDTAYKRCVGYLAKKKAALQNQTSTDTTGDFTVELPTQTMSAPALAPFDDAQAAQLARELSAAFKAFPEIETSQVTIAVQQRTERYTNNEGTIYARSDQVVLLEAHASCRADDNRELKDSISHVVRSFSALPEKAQLATEVRALAERLKGRRSAPNLDSYDGPVLFEGTAAPEIVLMGLSGHLTAAKRPVVGVRKFDELVAQNENPFMNKIGARVLPEFIDVMDDPTANNFKGLPLLASGTIDDEGVQTRRVTLVERGRLKTLLTSRVPAPGLPKSTGSRHGGGACPTNLIVTASEGKSAAEMRTELIKLAQQRGSNFGVVIRQISPELIAWRVYADGREEPIRSVEFTDLALGAFKDIDAAGADPVVHSTVLSIFRVAGSPSEEVVSCVAPALLFDDLTLRCPVARTAKGSALPPPVLDSKPAAPGAAKG